MTFLITTFYGLTIIFLIKSLFSIFTVEKDLIKTEDYFINLKMKKEGTISEIPNERNRTLKGILLLFYAFAGLFTYNGVVFFMWLFFIIYMSFNMLKPLMDKRIYAEDYDTYSPFSSKLVICFYITAILRITTFAFILANKFYFRFPLEIDFLYNMF
jgi:hypothetical protein